MDCALIDMIFLYAGYVGSLGDKPKVEIKGRFSVTSENFDLPKVGDLLSNAYSSEDSAPLTRPFQRKTK